jgi:hypothetical protein
MSLGKWVQRAVIFTMIAIALGPSRTFAALRQVTTHSLGTHRPSWTLLDLSGKFERQAIAVSASGDLLLFSARPNGNWELSRIHDWSGSQPEIARLVLPGYFNIGERHDLETLHTKLFLTHDGMYAICVGSAEWLKRSHGRAVGRANSDNMITVVNLHTMTIEGARRTHDLNLLEFQGVEMTPDGRVIVSSQSGPPQSEGVLIPLEIPSLREKSKCEFRWLATKPGEGDRPVPVTVESCAAAVSPSSIGEVLSSSSPFLTGFKCKDAQAGYCPQPYSFTPDQRFGIGVRTEGHDDLLGIWVQTSATAIVFSMSTRSEIGELDLMHDSPALQLASVAGRDYLLVLRGGTELTVYELLDENGSS